MKYKCLSIAGFDGSGGAGIQADIKTFSALGCYATTVLTALPVQNTCGVKSCWNIPPEVIEQQLIAIFEDIVPSSIKIGMLFSTKIIELVANFLQQNAKEIPIVLDPVMVAKSGDQLLLPDAIEALISNFIPLATIITPNIPEAINLIGLEIDNPEEIANHLMKQGWNSILLKGGHLSGDYCSDLFRNSNGVKEVFTVKRITSNNTHGTGCTLSSAICAYIALGFSVQEACKCAQKYLYGAMLASKDNSVGKGHGPVHHFYDLWKHL
jgi:hydroxymethylpyrimidine/phosphomethylpyrimidine kinase